jgi:predicted esterase
MRRLVIILLATLTVPCAVPAAEEPASFTGDWKTTFGPVRFDLNGAELTGRILAFNLPVKGKLEGKTLSAGYDEGQVHVDAKLTLEPSGHAFKGTFQASNGNRGVWSGWRPDPAAAKGEPAHFEGLWLTDLGLMELTQGGAKVKGRYALRGTSSLEGEVKGRHLEFRVKAFRPGPGWFDLDEKGDHLAGAGGTDGIPGWYGWNGRKAPEFARHAPLEAGKIVQGSTANLLTYCVRAPEGYKAGEARKWPAVVILHGSNMNANDYVSTLAAAWPDVSRDFIILGINGEMPSNLDRDRPTFNFTYVNYVGRSTYGGFPGTDRESPALVREALDDLKSAYPISSYFVGGHSQGGFLTYSLLMNSPEAIAGAFPISAGVIFQCEPSAYADDALKKAQRSVPLAVVHGKNDPMVSFTGGAYSYNLFLDAGWPAIRLFADENAAHMFARLPVGPAIRWLEVLASDRPAVLLDFAEKRLKDKERGVRDAIAALRRARSLPLDAVARARAEKLAAAIDAEAAPKAKRFLDAIKKEGDFSWLDEFLAYRTDFEYADAAAPAMAAFQELRARHEPPAAKLQGEARGLFQQGRRDDGRAKLKEIVEKHPAAPQYRLAKQWLAERN